MRPSQLQPEHFSTYPPLARQIATGGLPVLRRLPLAFVPLLLREVVAYDWKFPAEREQVDAQFTFLGSLTPERLQQVMAAFERLTLSPALEEAEWVKAPGDFSERLSAHLWTTNQVAAFRTAAIELLNAVRTAIPVPAPVIPRLGIVVVGQGVAAYGQPLFRKLRPHGTLFTKVQSEGGLQMLMQRASERANRHPVPFAHWYIEGGAPVSPSPAGMEVLAYAQLDFVRAAVVAKLRTMIAAGEGTEARRSGLALLRPEDVGLQGTGEASVLDHFKVSVLSEGSGPQFFSTTFVQWSAREVLRRAHPLTLLARFAPRMTERSMNVAMQSPATPPVLDAQGALADADMGAYYTWMNQMRLAGARESSFLVWFENHSLGLVISPSTRRGEESDRPVDLNQLLDQALG